VTAPLCLEEEEQVQTINPWVSILLTIVLSIHVILEGMTIGSMNDAERIRSVFIAVAVHKAFAAFSLGSSLVASGYWTMSAAEGGRTMFFVLAGVYMSLDVVGLGIGIGLNEAFEDETNIVAGVLQSLLGGSFLFVSTVELIPGELEKMRNFNMPLFPILSALLCGFGAMTVLGKWA
jgi:zinc transporter 1/2/3